MALVHSFVVPDRDGLQENMELYVQKILPANEMMKLMRARLHLVNASITTRKSALPHNDVTGLEHDLMKVRRVLLKLCMNRQLLNIALQKSVQSSLLHAVSRNLFIEKRLNYIEESVAEQMKLMIEKGERIRSLKEELDAQFVVIAEKEEKLLGRRVCQHERLSQLSNLSSSQEGNANTKDIMKTIRNTNRMQHLLTAMVMHILKNEWTAPEEKKEMVRLAAKWRTPRSLNYYSTAIVAEKLDSVW